MTKSTWILALPAVFLIGAGGAQAASPLSDQQLRDIAGQYAFNVSKRDSCRYSPEDLHEADIKELQTQLDPQQKMTFNVGMEQAELSPAFDHDDHDFADETWCKTAKAKLKDLLGK